MLLNFEIENWQSFRDLNRLSMVAGRERQHLERLPYLVNYRTRLLPVAAIYGGNASGKTNLFNALSFARTLVVDGTLPNKRIPVQPFRLEPLSAKAPCRFVFELLIDETVYAFSFSLNDKAILEEQLVRIGKTTERVLYHRLANEIKFDESLTDKQFLDFAFKGTRVNQLFLTNAVSQNVDHFRFLYDWFKDSLVILGPKSITFHDEDISSGGSTLDEVLALLDTGISRLAYEEVPLDYLPKAIIDKYDSEVGEDQRLGLYVSSGDRILFSRRDGELRAQRMVSFHLDSHQNPVQFEVHEESDGTRRLMDLVPYLVELSKPTNKLVICIDELDRSLHHLLSQRLIENYLAPLGPGSRSQLIFTTHDALLLDQDLFRRDELWVTEREASGCSSLTSLSAYKDLRYDKDLQKSYLNGRLGGIPKLLLRSRPC